MIFKMAKSWREQFILGYNKPGLYSVQFVLSIQTGCCPNCTYLSLVYFLEAVADKLSALSFICYIKKLYKSMNHYVYYLIHKPASIQKIEINNIFNF